MNGESYCPVEVGVAGLTTREAPKGRDGHRPDSSLGKRPSYLELLCDSLSKFRTAYHVCLFEWLRVVAANGNIEAVVGLTMTYPAQIPRR